MMRLARAALLGALFLVLGLRAGPAPQPEIPALPPVVESYYKIAGGKADEWLKLYRAEHLPILEARRRDGHILDITIYRPYLHTGEPPWDYKVILRFRDFAALGDAAHQVAHERRLYPDWEKHQQAERRRWEITEKHWDDLMVAEAGK